jgi:hypothetical protein
MVILWQQQAPLLQQALEMLGQLQESMQVMVENIRQIGCNLDNLHEIVHELGEEGEATNEQMKKSEPDSTIFDTEKPLPQPFGRIIEQLTIILLDLHATGVLDAGTSDPATQLAPVDEPSVTVVPAPTPSQPIGVLHDAIAASHTARRLGLFTPRRSLPTSPLPLVTTPMATFQIRRSLEFRNSTVVFKQRWQWKPVNDNEDAVADDLAGVVDGNHRTTGMIFPGGSYCSVSMNTGNTVVSILHPWSPMRFAIPAGNSFVQQRAGGQGLRPWRQIRLASFPRASGRFQNTRLELMPFLEVRVVRHFWEPLEGSRSTVWRVGLGRFWNSTWQELEQMKSWTVLPFGKQSFLDAHLLQGSGLSNWLGFCVGCYVG